MSVKEGNTVHNIASLHVSASFVRLYSKQNTSQVNGPTASPTHHRFALLAAPDEEVDALEVAQNHEFYMDHCVCANAPCTGIALTTCTESESWDAFDRNLLRKIVDQEDINLLMLFFSPIRQYTSDPLLIDTLVYLSSCLNFLGL